MDREGRIRFFTLLDSVKFDARLLALRAKLDQLLREEGTARATAPPLVVTPPGVVLAEPGSTHEARFVVTVRDGFHVQANPASEPFLVPLRLELPDSAAVEVGEAVYPAGRPHRLNGASRDLSVYGGSFALTAPLVVGASARAGEVRLRGSLHYQACNDRACLRPSRAPVELRVRVGPRPD
ncbi:MAG: protein-disulfide reductase DsbD domain-containing protein [Vicinamibacteria bacterium]